MAAGLGDRAGIIAVALWQLQRGALRQIIF